MLDIFTIKCLSEFRQPLVRKIITALQIPQDTEGLDAGCGMGAITKMLAESLGQKGKLCGLDVSSEFIKYAKKHYEDRNLEFIEGDFQAFPFSDHTFDWIWSMDAVWPGSMDMGCTEETACPIIQQLYRLLKPGGRLFLLYWSSQKLLPGYPLLEASLGTTTSATAPFTRGMKPEHHIMNGKKWLEQCGFKELYARTFTGDIQAPFSENDRKALAALFQMLWGKAIEEMTIGERTEYSGLCNPQSEKYIINNPFYYGFYTYTLFCGRK